MPQVYFNKHTSGLIHVISLIVTMADIEVTLESGKDNVEVDHRVWVAKNFSKENIEYFDKCFQGLAQQQNEQKEFVEKIGPVEIQCLPIKAHKRIQTTEEKKEKKRKYNIARNQLEGVKKKRKENAMKEENRVKREAANKLPENQRKKTLSGMTRRRALTHLKQMNLATYAACMQVGREKAEAELSAREEERQHLDKEISRLEKELGVDDTMSLE